MLTHEILQPENVQQVVFFGWFVVIGAIGLDWSRREAIRQRDEYQCQSPDKRIKCSGRLEVDHIIPKEFAETALKMLPEEYNSPQNLVLKCLTHHRGHPNSHHPDVHNASWREFKGEKGAIGKAVHEHHEKSKRGEIYWNNENDGLDRQIAKKRTKLMDEKMGDRSAWWPWKESKKNGTK